MNTYSIRPTKTGYNIIATWTEMTEQWTRNGLRPRRVKRTAVWSNHKTREDAEQALKKLKGGH